LKINYFYYFTFIIKWPPSHHCLTVCASGGVLISWLFGMFNIHILSEVHQHLKIDFCNYHFNLILIIFSYYVEVLSSSSFRVCYYSHLHHHFEFTFNSLLTLSTSLSSFIFIITLNLIYISQRIQECINNFSIINITTLLSHHFSNHPHHQYRMLNL
jgi:hypothetical protein